MNPRPHLQTLIFEVTQRCNHTCLHCYNVWQGEVPGATAYPRGELDTRRTLDLLNKALDETNCRHVTFTGGEPLLRGDLVELLDFVRQRGARATIISNGRLLDGARARELMDAGASLFELPLLSHRRNVHDRLSGGPGAWDAVLEAMANIRLQRGQCVAAFVATRLNYGDAAETMRLAFAFGARSVMFNRFNPGGRGRHHLDLLLLRVDELRQALAAAEATAAALSLPVGCSIPIQPCLVDLTQYPHLNFGFCAAGSERAYYTLDPLGNLRPCNHSDLVLGNLFEKPFGEIIEGDCMQAFARAVPDACHGCGQLLACQGGCKAAAGVCSGCLTAPEPFLARSMRAGWARLC
ncbi:MAG: radical SAM protein [Anaerolineae bacterium]|nr:radical SAM protein [Anaerolineae bacterium]